MAGMRAGAQSVNERESSDQGAVARLELVRPGLPAVSRVSTAAALAHERTLPLVAGLHGVIPAGCLQRGSTVAVHGPGATSFGLAVAAEAVRAGSFLAVVAPESFNMAACLDFDIPLRRVVQFVLPTTSDERREQSGRAQLLAAIIEGFDLVALVNTGPVPHRDRVTASQSRQLVARTRERGAVLMRLGGPAWSDAADLRFDLSEPTWQGIGRGHGHLRSRVLGVQAAGRRWHGKRGELHHLLLPGGEQGVGPTVLARDLAAEVVAAQFAGSDIDEMIDAVESASGDADEQGPGAGSSAVA